MASQVLSLSRRRCIAVASAAADVAVSSSASRSFSAASAATSSSARPAPCRLPGASDESLRARRLLSGLSTRTFATQSQTHLGAYLEQCGATWGDVDDVRQVEKSEDGRNFSWHVDLPEERLRPLRRGEPLESPRFEVQPGVNARFQLFPKGDDGCSKEGTCSLWLWTDSKANLGPIRLQLGEACERDTGASEFCALEDAVKNGAVNVRLSLLEDAQVAGGLGETPVSQRLHLTGLEIADWQIFHVADLLKRGELHSSPPFRFHHVLLGDMYLELLPGVPHPEHCTLFFRCRVPTMKLQVGVSAGNTFSKEFVALGRMTPEDDLKNGRCLQVNLDAPGVLGPDGSLKVKCTLNKVVSIPRPLQDMMPRLDERALWPKRL